MVSFLHSGPFRVLFIRVPYFVEDPKRDPNLENHPYTLNCRKLLGSYKGPTNSTTGK